MNDRKFHFEINSFADFLQFIAIIREEEMDLEKIEGITKKIEDSNQSLKSAIESQPKK